MAKLLPIETTVREGLPLMDKLQRFIGAQLEQSEQQRAVWQAEQDRNENQYRAWMDREIEQQRTNSEFRAAQDREQDRRWYYGPTVSTDPDNPIRPGAVLPVTRVELEAGMRRRRPPVSAAGPTPSGQAPVTTCPRCGAAVCTGHRTIRLP